MTIQDQLHRRPFARNIYNFIASSNIEEALRVGIYGRWGEGKTTVLSFIKEYAKEGHHEVVWFNPWNVQDLTHLFWELYFVLDPKVEEQTGFWKKSVEQLKFLARKAVPHLPKSVGESVEYKLVSSLTHSFLVKKIRKVLERKISNNKIVFVIIDDLDRTQPSLATHFLLSILEDFNLKGCTFLLGFDPQVIAKSLPSIHPGWGTTQEFLEKIIDYPIWLPRIEDSDILKIAETALKDLPFSIPLHDLKEVSHILPRNPRKLKQFFKNLWRLDSQIKRHGPEEIDWQLLLLIEIMKADSFRVSEALFNNNKLWEDLIGCSLGGSASETDSIMSQGDEVKKQDWENSFDLIMEKISPEIEEESKEKSLSCLKVFRDQISFHAKQNLKYWVALCESPPVFTWKEFRLLIERMRNKPFPKELEDLLKEHAQSRELPLSSVIQEIFILLLQNRGEQFEKASDSIPEEDLVGFIKNSKFDLNIIKLLVFDLHCFEGSNPPLLSKHFIELLAQFKKWAHWNLHEAYIQIHGEEEEMILEIAKITSKLAMPVLEELEIWNFLKNGGLGRDEANKLEEKVIEVWKPQVFKELCERFERDNGISNLWPEDRHLTLKYFLLYPSVGFYSPEVLSFLESLRAKARANRLIQTNFYEFFLLLDYAIRKRVKIGMGDDLITFIQESNLLEIVWKAAIASRLQPRVIGTLEDVRKRFNSILSTEKQLSAPDWFDEKP